MTTFFVALALCIGIPVGVALGRTVLRPKDVREPARQPGACVVSDLDYRTAVHEAGHAVCAWFDPFMRKITRIEVHDHGGMVLFTRADTDRSTALWYRVVVELGGIAAEVKYFQKFRSGQAKSDLLKAVELARVLATRGDLTPPWSDPAEPDPFDLSKMLVGVDSNSNEALVLNLAYARAKFLVVKDKARLDRVADAVVDKRVLVEQDVQQLFGWRWPIFF